MAKSPVNTVVAQVYGGLFNTSVTTKDGVPTKVTIWTSGNDASQTQHLVG